MNEKDYEFFFSFFNENHRPPLLFVLWRLFNVSTDNKAQMFALYYGLNGNGRLSVDEIAVKFGLSRERVRQIVFKREFLSNVCFSNIISLSEWLYCFPSINGFLSVSQ